MDCEEPEVPAGWSPNYESESEQQNDASYYDLVDTLALGPCYGAPYYFPGDPQYGQSAIPSLYAPYPNQEMWNDEFRSLRIDVLWYVYGGPEGLADTVQEACQTNNCNNPVATTEFPNIWHTTYIGQSKNDAKAFFLDQIGADSSLLINYEPLYMSELQRQYPEQLTRAQIRFTINCASGPEAWWLSHVGYTGGKQ